MTPKTPRPSGPCVNCGEMTINLCQACQGGFDKHGKQIKNVFSCSAVCRKNDKQSHGVACKQARMYRQLYRIADLARDLFYTYAEHTFPYKVWRLSKEKKNLYYHISMDGRFGFSGLSKTVVPDMQDRRALMAQESCGHSMIVCKDLLVLGLKGIYEEIEEVAVVVKGARLNVRSVHPCGQRGSVMNQHELFRIRLLNGESFAIDITAAQYGHEDVIMPWDEYCSKRISKVAFVNRLGSTSVQKYFIFAQFVEAGCVEIANIQLAHQWLYPVVNRVLLKWLADAKGKTELPVILQLPERAYVESKSHICQEVSKTLAVTLKKARKSGGVDGVVKKENIRQQLRSTVVDWIREDVDRPFQCDLRGLTYLTSATGDACQEVKDLLGDSLLAGNE